MAESDVTVHRVGPRSVVSVSAWPDRADALALLLSRALGLQLARPGRWTAAGDLVCVWTAPTQWQVQRAGRQDLLAQLDAVVGDAAGLIDLSDASVVLRLGGAGAREVLARLLPIDLHPRAFGPTSAARSYAAHMTVQVRQLDVAPTYELACAGSYAGSLWRALELAGARAGEAGE